ncbi:MAG: cyclic nucleotide-binding domain-containing protein, partial [Cyanobacteriota bacterium]
LESFNDSSISYVLEFTTANYGDSGGPADELMRRLWYVARRDGLTIPYPTSVSLPYSEPAATQPEARQKERLQSLRNSSFALLPAEHLERLATSSLVRDYAASEVVLLQGTPLTSLFLILAGEAEMLVNTDDGSSLPMGILSMGEFFGERVSLLYNRIADTTVRAATDLRVLVIDGKTLGALIEAHPRLARDLTGVMEIRQRAMDTLKRDHGGQPTRELRLIEG